MCRSTVRWANESLKMGNLKHAFLRKVSLASKAFLVPNVPS